MCADLTGKFTSVYFDLEASTAAILKMKRRQRMTGYHTSAQTLSVFGSASLVNKFAPRLSDQMEI